MSDVSQLINLRQMDRNVEILVKVEKETEKKVKQAQEQRRNLLLGMRSEVEQEMAGFRKIQEKDLAK